MRSIKTKLISAFLAIIGVLIVSEIVFVVMDLLIIKKYNDFTDTMTSEYRLIDASSSLVESFNGLIKYTSDQSKINEFNAIRSEIKSLLVSLDSSIVDEQSRLAYFGLKNTINNVISECDAGVANALQGNYSDVSNHYDEASRKNTFVRENTANLILKELEYGKKLQDNIKSAQQFSGIIGLLLFAFASIGCIWYSIIFSRKIILPLIRLTKLARVVEGGNLNANVEQDLLKINDEVGSLANSFNTMMIFLRGNIHKLEEYNEQLIEAKHDIDLKNEELERINSLMVGRELKMVELKERLKKFEKDSK